MKAKEFKIFNMNDYFSDEKVKTNLRKSLAKMKLDGVMQWPILTFKISIYLTPKKQSFIIFKQKNIKN